MSVRREFTTDANGKKTGFWRVDVKAQQPDGKTTRVRKASSTWTKREALDFESRARQAIRSGTYKSPKQQQQEEIPTVKAFSAEFLEVYAKNNNKPSEQQAKESIFRLHLDPFFGDLKLDQVGVRHIERFKHQQRQKGLAKKTINNQLTVLRCMLSMAVDWEILDHVPKVKWFKVPKPDFDFLTFEEADRLLGGAEDEWRAMIMTGLKTGLRLSELLALRRKDVNLKTGLLTVRQAYVRSVIGVPKSGKGREIPLSDELIACLKAHRHLRGEYVFCQEDGSILAKGMSRWPLWRACKAAGLRKIGWHVLRHTFASHLFMRSAPPKAVQELMGHSTLEMTMRYAHLSPDVKRDTVQLLDGPVVGAK